VFHFISKCLIDYKKIDVKILASGIYTWKIADIIKLVL